MNSNAQCGNELSLAELIKTFWEQRALILIVTFMCFCLSLAYLFFVKPTYEANAFVAPPISLDLSGLNAAAFHSPKESVLKKYSVTHIYDIYIQNLISDSARRRFFEKVYLPYIGSQAIESREQAYQKLINTLKIKQDPQDKNNYKVSLLSHSSLEAKDLLSKYLQLAFEGLIRDIKMDFNYQIKAKLLNTKSDMTSIRLLSQKYIANSLTELQNSLNEANAEKLNHVVAGNDKGHFESFMLGTKILTARINGLKKREISSELVKQYLQLKTDYNYYSSVENNFSPEIQSTQFVSEVFTPDLPISPKRGLVLVIGLLTGLFCGCLASLFLKNFKVSGYSITILLKMMRSNSHLNR